MKHSIERNSKEYLVKAITLFLFITLSFTVSAQAPANDACQNASGLGALTLNTQLCTTGGTTVDANPEFPYIALTGCSGSAASSPTSAADVWYTFTTPANTNELIIDLTSTMTGAHVAIFEGTCGALTASACAGESASGNLSEVLSPVFENTTYYIRVSGNDDNDQSAFTLCITANENTGICVTQSTFTTNPAPVNGVYYPGDVVEFCYTVTEFQQISANWLHGIEIQFGTGWAPGSFFVTGIPTSCDGNGNWGFYNSITGAGGTFGQGFYYDSQTGSPAGVLDGDPGNNFGDNCTQYNWVFCWELTVGQPPPGSCGAGSPALDLSIQILQYGDSETGGWSSAACANDPPINFPVVISCCEQPTFNTVDASCASGASGSITATGNGIAPFTYNWDNGGNTNTITSLSAGSYNLTVTDSTGCQVIATEVVQLIGGLGTTSGSENVSCFNAGDGKAWITPTNGAAPYTYVWNTTPVQNTDTAFNLGPGTYEVTATDAGGCADTVSFTITQEFPVRPNLFSSPTGCGALGTGSAWSITAGGTAPYTFAWSTTPVQTNDTAFNLTAGSYTLTVTDANGCSATRTTTVATSTGFTATTSSDSTCFGSATGMAWVIPSGGATPYSYQWSTTPVQNTDTAFNLAAGSYTVTTTDAGGCSTTNSVTVLSSSAMVLSTDADSTICTGAATGKAWVSATGAGPFTYNWNTTPVQNTDTAFNLAAGNYDVTVTDANGCTSVSSVQVFDALPLGINMFADSIGCFGANNANVWAVVSGGTAPYNYTWSSGTPVPTNDTITNVTAGTYSLTIVDANGCSDSATINVLQQANLNLTGATDSASCSGVADGRAWVTASGGTSPFTYRWGTAPVQITDTAVGLRGNIYNVTVTDANGCQDFLVLTVGEPPGINIAISADSVLCNGTNTGLAYATVTGGIGGYTFSWSGGAGGGSNGGTSGTTDTTFGLSAGNYTVTVVDGVNCSATASVDVFEPTVLVANAFTDSVSCNGGNDGVARVVASGGIAPYTYAWSGGTVTPTADSIVDLTVGTYSVTVTDANACEVIVNGIDIGEPTALNLSANADSANCFGATDGSIDLTVTGGSAPYSIFWSNGVFSEDLNGIAAGDYTPAVTDAKGCFDTLPTITVFEPAALATVTGIDSVTCNGTNDGRAYVGVSGGTPGYTYVWNSVPVQNTDTASNLSVGNYTVNITDANGCAVSDAVTVAQAGGLAITTGVDSVSCNGGSDGRAWINATGGSGSGYVYSWGTTPVQNTDTISGLIAGTYNVTAADGSGCSLTASVTVEEPSALSLGSTINDVSCNQGTDGSIVINPSGGYTGYSYNWSSSNPGSYVGSSISSAEAGTYNVTVTDGNGCEDSLTALNITEPTALSLSIASTDALCANSATGTINVTVTGATAPYSFAWTNNLTGQNPTNVLAGNYRVTVTDANGCFDTISTVINEPPGFTVSGIVTNVSCFGLSDGEVDLTVSGGTAPYVYSWNTSSSTVNNGEDVTGLIAELVSVSITDANGCDTLIRFTITEPDSFGVAIDLNIGDFSCTNNVISGQVTSSVIGGVAPYTYDWSNGDVSPNTNNVSVANYQLTVTDANGCVAVSDVIIDTIEPITARIDVDSAACYGDDNGQAVVTVLSGVEQYNGYSFEWQGLDDPVVGSRALNIEAGIYSVTVTDSLGCDTIIDFTVAEQPEMIVDAGPDVDVIFGGDSTLTATVDGLRPSDNVTYSWTPADELDCTDCPDPLVTPIRDITYTVVVDVNGCVYEDTIRVTVNFDDKVFYAPNAFSPNNDDINDVYYLYAKGVKKIYWTVHNRWGELVYLGRSLTEGWNGTLNGNQANQGVYVLHVFVQYQDGTSQRMSQSIMLLR